MPIPIADIQNNESGASVRTKLNEVIGYINTGPAFVYRALLSQIGTSPPAPIVFENTLNGSVVWSYNAPGSYLGTLVGAFTVNKCFVVVSRRNANEVVFVGAKAPNVDSDDILLETFNGTARANNLMGDGIYLEVLVYP